MSFSCSFCNKNYKSYQSFWNHNKIYHPNEIIHIISNNKIRNFQCTQCNKKFTTKHCMEIHMVNACKKKPNENEVIKAKLCELEKKLKEAMDYNEFMNKLEKNHKNNTQNIDKPKTPEKPDNKYLFDNIEEDNKIIVEENKTLTYNEKNITIRPEDNYIDAHELCKVDNKQFDDWFSLESTKEIIADLSINSVQKIDGKIWIHPDLAQSLAYWISPNCGLVVSKWIKKIYSKDALENEIKIKNKKIKILEDMCIKKQKRQEYPQSNVIYMLTTLDNYKKGIYIIGKAKKLTNRLSSYNKTAEHKVIYYKECIDENIMNLVELMVLTKLDHYREKANRDRFILPKDCNISLFIDTINQSIEFLTPKNKINEIEL
jgi:hypothetical protein